MATRTETARLLMYKAACLNDYGTPNPQASSMATRWDGRAVCENADEAVQSFGGMGYVDEMPAEKFYCDAKISKVYEGIKEVRKWIIARSSSGWIKGRGERSLESIQPVTDNDTLSPPPRGVGRKLTHREI